MSPLIRGGKASVWGDGEYLGEAVDVSADIDIQPVTGPLPFITRTPEQVTNMVAHTVSRAIKDMKPGEWLKIERNEDDNPALFNLTVPAPASPRCEWE